MMMRRHSLWFVVSVIIASVFYANLIEAALKEHDFRAYNAIEEYLNRFAKSKDDYNSIMSVAKSWLVDLKTKDSPSLKSSLVLRNCGGCREEVVNALEEFVAFGSVVANKQCDQHSYTVRYMNQQMVREMEYLYMDPYTFRATIGKLSIEHASYCQTVHPERYQAKAANLNQTVAHYLDVLLNEVLFVKSSFKFKAHEWVFNKMSKGQILDELKDESQRARLFREFVIKGTCTEPYMYSEEAYIVYQGIERILKEDSDQDFVNENMQKVNERYTISSEHAKRVLQRYLLDPCAHYYAQLGPNIFAPAHQDVLTLLRGWRTKVVPMTAGNLSEYYLSWAKYRVCEELLGSPSQQMYLTENIKRCSSRVPLLVSNKLSST